MSERRPLSTLRVPVSADRLVLAEAVAITRQAMKDKTYRAILSKMAAGIEPAQGSPGVRVAEPAAA